MYFPSVLVFLSFSQTKNAKEEKSLIILQVFGRTVLSKDL